LRNPYDAIWAEYLRIKAKGHVGSLKIANFDSESFKSKAVSMSKGYCRSWLNSYVPLMNTLPQSNYTKLMFEDLVSPQTRYKALEQVMNFLDFHPSQERLECAFILADDPHAHRPKSADDMTKDKAYTKDIVCDMWKYFGKYALRTGYKPYGGYDCPLDTSDEDIKCANTGSGTGASKNEKNIHDAVKGKSKTTDEDEDER
jgi:hypothetical protein